MQFNWVKEKSSVRKSPKKWKIRELQGQCSGMECTGCTLKLETNVEQNLQESRSYWEFCLYSHSIKGFNLRIT